MDCLRRAGARVTTPRRVVVSVLAHSREHLSADDVAARVQALEPSVHLSTVYRTLEALEALGLAEHTHVGHGATLYHLGPAHTHLVCEHCGAVTDAPIALLDDLRSDVHVRFGFRVHAGHFALLGLCRGCSDA